MEMTYYVYILSNPSRRLYIGVTNDLRRRMHEHRTKAVPSFASRYNLTRLVFYESTRSRMQAIVREKQLKGWRRDKKLALIESGNPLWLDLAQPWFEAPD